MFFLAFGGAWLECYAVLALAGSPVVMIGIALVAVGLLMAAYRRYRQLRATTSDAQATTDDPRARRIFNWVNAGQWLAIIVIGNILVRVHMSEWVIPSAIMIVGLHLIPLAWNFSYRAHYVTGAALMAVAVAYPLLSSAGPRSPVGCLGAGLILWASALWALWLVHRPQPLPDANEA